MTKKFSVPRGTTDILPDEIPAWQNLEETARRILKNYCYSEIRTPIFEELNLFKRSLGQTSDVVNKQLLELASSRNMEGGSEVVQEIGNSYALRPEGTAAVVRSYIENNFDKREPLSKLFYIGPMFRGERPQKGRLRQFHQIGVEAIGPNSTSPLLDAEIMTLAMHLLKDLGVRNPKLKINSLGSKEDKENTSLWLRGKLSEHRQNLCEDCQSRLQHNVLRILDCKNMQCKKIIRDAFFVENIKTVDGYVSGQGVTILLSSESSKYFSEVKERLNDLGIAFEVSLDLVRGLDYYTHIVFEITAEGLGSQDAVGAGGRYGGLIHELGGAPNVDYGAIGFALGIERILLSKGNIIQSPQRLKAFVVSMQPYEVEAFQLVNQLRQADISADMSFSVGSFKSQMSRANKLCADFALILGEEEVKSGEVTVKDMHKSTQKSVNKNEIIDYLRKAFQ